MDQKTSWVKRLFRVSFKELFVRFPFSIASALIATGIASYITIEEFDERIPAVLLTGIWTAALGVLWFTALAFFGERKYRNSLVVQFGGLIPIALFAFYIHQHLIVDEASAHVMSLFMMLFLASFVFLIISAYIQKRDELAFWQFSKWLFLRIFLAIFSSLVLFGALALALVSIDRLFGVDIKDKYYFVLWQWIAMVFAPVFVLLGAKKMEEYDADESYPEIVRKFAQYILSPILVVYFIILYAYMAKILFFARQWPEGSLAMPVIIYTTVVIITMLLTFPWYRRGQTTTATKTLKYLFFSVIPVIPMYFIALGIRIGEYGITEIRYFGVAIGLWFTFVILTSLLKKFHNIRIIFGSLALVTFFSAVGPWSMFNTSYISQSNQFIQSAAEDGLIDEDGMFDVKEFLAYRRDYSEEKRTRNIVRYLDQHHDFNRVIDLFVIDYTVSGVTPDEQVKGQLNLYHGKKTAKEEFFHYYGNYPQEFYGIEGYDRMMVIAEHYQDSTVLDKDGVLIVGNPDQTITVTIGDVVLEKDISDFVEIAKDDEKREFVEDNRPLEWNLENETHRVKIIVQNMSGEIVEDKMTSLDIGGFVLIGEK